MRLPEDQMSEIAALMPDLDKRDHERRAAEFEAWEDEQERQAAADEALSDGGYDRWRDAQNEEHEARIDAGKYRPTDAETQSGLESAVTSPSP